jgi:collagenase-like PrtC family protease
MMELLAPAGNIEQAKGSIDSGADAIYGGLRQWNARARAKNFTLTEYTEVLDYCHSHRARFYLTLNTLLYDHELAELTELFHSSKFTLPDAVIVADIGLIRVLGKEFSNLTLHASTQFGTATVADLRLLEELGVSRAILARELTLKEVEVLRKSTGLELEVFAFGSQCISFSGQCLWAGLLQRGSGNRGYCTGMCRDVYEVQGKQGQFFYPQDINAISILPQLTQAGVQSIKIEGRSRPVEEISKIVQQFRAALNNPTPLPPSYAGYLQNDIPVKGMFHVVNPRTAQYLKDDTTEIKKPGVEKDTLSFLDTIRGVSLGKNPHQSANKSSDFLFHLMDGIDKNHCILETDRLRDICVFSQQGYHRFIFACSDLLEIEKAKTLCSPEIEVTYKLPILDFTQKLENILIALEGEAIMVTRLSHLYSIRDHFFKAILADYSLNLWNTPGTQWVQDHGVQHGTVHPEAIGVHTRSLFPGEQVIVVGKLPLAHTRACFQEIGLCPGSCTESIFDAQNVLKHYTIEVYCHKDLAYRTIRSADPIVMDTTDFVWEDRRVVLTGLL